MIPEPEAGDVQVFVYGTLTDPDRAREVVSDARFVRDATLYGLHRVEGAYPTLAPGGTTEGRILETSSVDALDAYEGTDRGLYVRATVPATDGGSVELYVGDPAKLNADADWSDGAFPACVPAYIAEEAVHVD